MNDQLTRNDVLKMVDTYAAAKKLWVRQRTVGESPKSLAFSAIEALQAGIEPVNYTGSQTDLVRWFLSQEMNFGCWEWADWLSVHFTVNGRHISPAQFRKLAYRLGGRDTR
jgi:hypothetical protein